MLNLDTHVLLHAVAGRLRPHEAKLLGRAPWSISAIVLWEIAKLAQLRRIEVDLDDVTVVRVLAAVHVWPLTGEIARASTRLDFRSDPADELIAATSLVHNVPLLTRDKRLLGSKLLPFAKLRDRKRQG
jgi:predicted nucleic acid-binding protein